MECIVQEKIWDALHSDMKKKKEKTDQQLKEMWRKKCVDLAKKIAKKRDREKCVYCGAGKPQRQVHSHHFFHEGLNKSMSADVDNLVTLCPSHHQGGFLMPSTGRIFGNNNGFNFHNSPAESTLWFKEKYPERYKALLNRSRKTIVCTLQMWKDKYEELKKEYGA